MQEFLIEAGHEADGISRNGDFDTPLHIAVESSEAVAKLLAQRFPHCIAIRNKAGADGVRLPATLLFFLKKMPSPPVFFLLLLYMYIPILLYISSSEIFCYLEVGGEKMLIVCKGKKQADHAPLPNTTCLTPSYSHIPLPCSPASAQSTSTSFSPGSRPGRKYSASLRLCVRTVERHSGFAGGRSGSGEEKCLELDSR